MVGTRLSFEYTHRIRLWHSSTIGLARDSSSFNRGSDLRRDHVVLSVLLPFTEVSYFGSAPTSESSPVSQRRIS